MQADRHARQLANFFLRGANMYGVQQFCEIKTTHLEITKKHETF
jgi:hypothetical protein